MNQPAGFSTNSHQVCRLNKAIYGLKQAPRAWYKKLSTALLHLGLKSTTYDASLFTRAINNLINTLSQTFSLKDLGRLDYFFGIEAH